MAVMIAVPPLLIYALSELVGSTPPQLVAVDQSPVTAFQYRDAAEVIAGSDSMTANVRKMEIDLR